ncbi:hypothetical protein Tco_1526050 [Tanacetum coccineum]
MWTNKGGLGVVDQIRRERPKDVKLDNWNKLVDSWIGSKGAHRAKVNSRNRLANKIVSLQGSLSLAQSRHQYALETMTEREILAHVLGGKQYQIFIKGQKRSQNRQNRAREWKERKKSNPKTCAS